MKTWYKCTVKYNKIDDNGKNAQVSEPYLIDAVSYTEAEARIYEKIAEEVDGAFFISKITKTNIIEILNLENSEGYFYQTKFAFVTADEESGKEKKISNNYLIAARDVDEAISLLRYELKTMLVPYDILSVSFSPVLDVFPFESEEE